MTRLTRAALLAALLCLPLTGCGNKGALYLPDAGAAQPSAG